VGAKRSYAAHRARGVLYVLMAGAVAILSYAVSAQAREVLLLAGGGFAQRSFSQYTGIIIPLINGKNAFLQDGPILRFWQKSYGFSYETQLPPTSPAQTRINAFGASFSAELGYQKTLSRGRLAGYLGLTYRKFRLSPKDPGADLDKNPVGIPLTLDGTWPLFDKVSVASNLSYTVFQKEYWAQMKIAYQPTSSTLSLGPEVVVQGGSEYRYLRLGAFVSGIKLGNFYLGFNLGLRDDLRENQQSLYGDFNLSFFY